MIDSIHGDVVQATAQPGLTIGGIAQRIGLPVHRVQYAVLSRGIKPSFRIGRMKVFDESQVKRIEAECRRIENGRRW
jgi:hypothetical protein